MLCQEVKKTLNEAVSSVAASFESYVYSPEKDFSRVKKISPEQILSFLITQGAGSTKCEWLDFFQLSTDAPSVSAMNQRRSQIKPDAFKQVFLDFTSKMQSSDSNLSSQNEPDTSTFRFIAADGSSITFFSFPKFASEDYYVSEGHSMRGFYSLHINAFYDLTQRVYTDAFLQAVHNKDEFRAFCTMVDEHSVPSGEKHVFIGDRGYCSYNNMAHVIKKEQFFLFRTKDKERKGLIGNFDFPESPVFDIDICVSLTRTHRKSVKTKEGAYRRYIDPNASFDYIEPGSDQVFDLEFRVLRFPISEHSYECIITNLPREQFQEDKIKQIYRERWGIESSFRKLKYTIGLTNYHSYKPEFIEQEVWAKLTAYNATEFMIGNVVVNKKECKYEYAINFSVAAHLCRIYLGLLTKIDSIDIEALIMKELIPIREDRQFPRLKTAHFRKPKYLIYRAA